MCYCLFSHSVVTTSSPNSADFWRERWEKNANLCGEDYYYDSLVFCQRHIDLEFDKKELNHQDKKRCLDPISIRMSQWYSEPICGGNDSQPIAFTRMNEDSSGTKRSQYQIPRPVVKDEERLARRKDDMPPPLTRRTNNPRIRDLPALTEFYLNTDKIHHATSEDACAQAWFNYSQSIFPKSIKKTCGNVEQILVSTYQRIILFNMGSFNRKSEFRKSQNLSNPIAKK